MLLPFGTLVLATALAVASDTSSSRKLLEDLGLAALTGAWMALIYGLRPRWQQHRWLMGMCFAVLLALMAALVLRNPLFGFFTWTGYIWAGLVLPIPWRLPGYVPVAVITGTSQHGGLPTHSASSWIGWIAFIAINLIAAGALSWIAKGAPA